MQYIIYILIGIGSIALWQGITFIFNRSFKKGLDFGKNQTIATIFNQIKNKGQIDLSLDENKITLIELKKVSLKKEDKKK